MPSQAQGMLFPTRFDKAAQKRTQPKSTLLLGCVFIFYFMNSYTVGTNVPKIYGTANENATEVKSVSP